MAGTTTRGAFPYPSPSDADDVPADLQRLAERIAAAVQLLGSTSVVVPHTWAIPGPISVDNAGNDFYIPPMYVHVPAGQTVTYVGLRMGLKNGTSVGFQLQRNGTNIFGGTTSATAQTTPASHSVGSGLVLADNDAIAPVVQVATGSPKNLTISAYFRYTV